MTNINPKTITSLHGEDAILVGVQSALAGRPGVLSTARTLSRFGEHGLGWFVISAIGFLVSRKKRQAWLEMGIATFCAHAIAVILKQIVRRKRPQHPAIVINVGTPSQLSFPSAHTTSTTTAVLLLGKILGFPLAIIIVPLMALSRLILGVHYPSDVATGVAIGAGVAALATRWEQQKERVDV